MKVRTHLAVVFLSVAVLVGCGSNPAKVDDVTAADGTVQNDDTDGATASGVNVTDADQQGLAIDPDSVAGRAPQERGIYFDFDEFGVRAEYLDVIAQHGRFLAQNPEGRVRLEGHTDERGTREYNIALGETRAKSIARMLKLQGVSSAQVRTVSYGEELPVDEGHNNDAWAKNRRVNIIYEVAIQN